jgi:FkbM family methyltransferase
MLIKFPDLVKKHNLNVTGILHLGACLAEEADMYAEAGVNHVIWFEANPQLSQIILDRIEKYPENKLVSAVVADKIQKEVDFNIIYSKDESNLGCSSLLPLHKHLEYYPDIQQIAVIKLPCITIDGFFVVFHTKHEQLYNFVNLDLQGAELLALNGMKKTLEHVDCVYTEVAFEELYKDCPLVDDITDFLEDAGFELVELAKECPSWGDAVYIRKQ